MIDKTPIMHISPSNWELAPTIGKEDHVGVERLLGADKDEIEQRCRNNTYEWLMRQFDEGIGAFHGYYDPGEKDFSEPQTANLIAPWQLLAAFERYGDEQLLEMARRSIDWLDANMVDSHPMSLVLGGVQDNIKPEQLWTKFTADYVVTNVGVYEQTRDEIYLHRALQSGKFLLQAQRHEFAPMYNRWRERWSPQGWQSFGRVINAMLAVWQASGDEQWLDWAMDWAEYGVTLHSPDDCFYLVHDQYYNSDVAADEIRALVTLSRICQRPKFLQVALRFADWHLAHQRENGSWWLAIDRHGIQVSEYVGPGDPPNIAIALLLVHRTTDSIEYLRSAAKALRHCLSLQAIPGDDYPYNDDPNTRWGFWSWDPPYDYTMSPDRSTHHVRALWFFLDYCLSLPAETIAEAAEGLSEADSA